MLGSCSEADLETYPVSFRTMANVKRSTARHTSKRSLARQISKRSHACHVCHHSPCKCSQPWTKEELSDVLQFVDDHKGVPWEKKKDLWYQKHGISRGIDSIRGKYYYLISKANRNDVSAQRTPSASGTVESFHTATESDLARLETQPLSTTEYPESLRYHHARQNHPLYSSTHEIEDSERLLPPPIIQFNQISMRPGRPRFDDLTLAAARMDFQTGFDSKSSVFVFRLILLMLLKSFSTGSLQIFF